MPLEGEFFSLREQRECRLSFSCSNHPSIGAPKSPHIAPATRSDASTTDELSTTLPLLNSSFTEVFHYWTAPVLKYCFPGLLLCSSVPVLNCCFTEVFLCWTVPLLNCCFTELSLFWSIPVLNYFFTVLLLYSTMPLVLQFSKLRDSEVSQPELPLRLLQISFESNSSKSMEGHIGKWWKWPLPGPACHDIFINSAGWDPSWGGSAHVLA